MVEQNFISEAFQIRNERLQERRQTDMSKERTPSVKERIKQDPVLAETVEKVHKVLETAPDVRKDRVEEIKKRLKEGTLQLESKTVAENFLQESILNEFL